jgi:hypothetical protein
MHETLGSNEGAEPTAASIFEPGSTLIPELGSKLVVSIFETADSV